MPRIRGFLITVLMFLSVPWDLRANEAPLCSETDLNGCGSSDSEECNNSLTIFYACGKYNEIIQHFAAEDFTTGPQARYFKGVSYYGLYLRNKSMSLKCQFSKLAKSELAGYLYQRTELGVSNPRDFDRVYQASKIISELKNLKGCLEDGLSEDEIRFHVRQYSESRLKSLFVGSPQKDGLGQMIGDIKTDIQITLSSFMTKASKIETQLELREVAMTASQSRLGKIAEAFDESMGNAKITRNKLGDIIDLQLSLDESRGFTAASVRAQNWHDQVASIEKQLLSAFDGVSVNEYEKARKNNVIRARYTIAEAASHLNLSNKISASESLPFFIDESKRPSDLNNPTQIISQIEKSLKASEKGAVDCAFFDPAPWYCETSAEIFNPLPG